MSMIKRLTVLALAAFVVACAGTKLAYDSATTLEAKAYVVSEHYAAVLREANELADRGAPAELVSRMQAADRVAAPLVLKLRGAAQAYTAVRSADNAAALQAALDAAVVEVAAFLRVLQNR